MRGLLAFVLAAGLVVPAWAKDIVVTEADLQCVKNWPKPDGYKTRIFNKKKRLLKKAIKVLQRDKAGRHYPVGTIIELIPPIDFGDLRIFGEAMVKHKKGFNS